MSGRSCWKSRSPSAQRAATGLIGNIVSAPQSGAHRGELSKDSSNAVWTRSHWGRLLLQWNRKRYEAAPPPGGAIMVTQGSKGRL